MSECNCLLKPNDDRDYSVCNADGPGDVLCTKPDGHDGPHSACSPAQHPIEVWDDE